MLNAYQFGQLTASPARFTKYASKNRLSQTVMEKFCKSAAPQGGIAGERLPVSGPEGGIAGERLLGATPTNPADVGSYGANAGLAGKAKRLMSGLTGTSESIGKALGGEAGQGFLKNPHTRTIAALLALLTAGGVGARALGGGHDKER